MSVEWPSEGSRAAKGSPPHIEYLPDQSDVSAGVHRCTICGDRIYTSKRVREHGCTAETTCPVCDAAVTPHWTPILVAPGLNECTSCGYLFTEDQR